MRLHVRHATSCVVCRCACLSVRWARAGALVTFGAQRLRPLPPSTIHGSHRVEQQLLEDRLPIFPREVEVAAREEARGAVAREVVDPAPLAQLVACMMVMMCW